MLDSILEWAVVFLPTVLSIAGVFVSIRIPGSHHHRRWYIGLLFFGIFVSAVTFWQQSRSRASHGEELQKLQALLGKIEGNTSQPPRVSVNVPPAQVIVAPQGNFANSPEFTKLIKKLNEVTPPESSSDKAVMQRFLREDRIGKMLRPLWIGKDREIMLMHDGSFEARGFSKQIELLLDAAGWKIIGVGERYPSIGTNAPMTVKGPRLDDPAVLALQAAFTIAGFDVQYRDGGENARSMWFEF